MKNNKEYQKWLNRLEAYVVSLEHVPKKYKTAALCEVGVKSHGTAIQFVPEDMITPDLCEMAVRDVGLALAFVPKEFITQELCAIAVKKYGYALEFVPEELKTRELCEIALEDVLDPFKDEFLESYVPEELHNEFKKTNERGR